VIVLDTHAWIWWIAEDEKFKPVWKAEIETASWARMSFPIVFERRRNGSAVFVSLSAAAN
jgi:PIN domain nuclease of toxin-antitoxin system